MIPSCLEGHIKRQSRLRDGVRTTQLDTAGGNGGGWTFFLRWSMVKESLPKRSEAPKTAVTQNK